MKAVNSMKRKKLLSALMALSMILPLASCGSPQQNAPQQNTSQQESADTDNSQQSSDNISTSHSESSVQESEASEASDNKPEKPYADADLADTQPKIVFEKGGKSFFASKIFYYLNDDTEDSAVMVQAQDSSPSHFYTSSKSLAFCGDEFYGVEHGSCNSIIWHVYADDKGTMHKEMLYTPDKVLPAAKKYCDKKLADEEIKQTAESELADEVRGIMREDYKKQYPQTGNSTDDQPSYEEFEESHLQEYLGKYRASLYQKHYDNAQQKFWYDITDRLCYNICDPADGGDGYIYASLYLNRKRCLIRFAKDGSSYEILSDILLSSFTICNGWLYYYYSGAAEADINGNTSYDANLRGIYKMRLDGSEKSKLCGNIPHSKFTSSPKMHISGLSYKPSNEKYKS